MILVTGGNGLIGSAIAERLARKGEKLRLQVRRRCAIGTLFPDLLANSSIEIVELDFALAREADYLRLVAGCESVIHTAGLVHKPQSSPELYEILNRQATASLAQAARDSSVGTFVFLSSMAVYGAGPLESIAETAPLKAQGAYALSKAASEADLKSHPPCPRLIILRPSLVFGPGDRGNMISLIARIDSGRYFHIGGNRATKSLIFSLDAAAAVLACLEKVGEGCHTFNLSNRQATSVIALSDVIAGVLQRRTPLPSLPEALLRAGASIAEAFLGRRSPLTCEQIDKLTTTTTCSVEALVAATGFEPASPLSEALKAEIDWARSAGILTASR